ARRARLTPPRPRARSTRARALPAVGLRASRRLVERLRGGAGRARPLAASPRFAAPLAPARRTPAVARRSRRRWKLQGADHDRLSPAGTRLRGFAVRRPPAHLRRQSRYPRCAEDSAAQCLRLVFPRRTRDLRPHPGGYGGARALAAGLVV